MTMLCSFWMKNVLGAHAEKIHFCWSSMIDVNYNEHHVRCILMENVTKVTLSMVNACQIKKNWVPMFLFNTVRFHLFIFQKHSRRKHQPWDAIEKKYFEQMGNRIQLAGRVDIMIPKSWKKWKCLEKSLEKIENLQSAQKFPSKLESIINNAHRKAHRLENNYRNSLSFSFAGTKITFKPMSEQ